jgi:hypothetical protein
LFLEHPSLIDNDNNDNDNSTNTESDTENDKTNDNNTNDSSATTTAETTATTTKGKSKIKKVKTKTKKKKPEKDRVRDLDWGRVAELVGNGRKSAECLRRYNKICGHRGGEKAAALKGPWTEEEDRKVIALVTAHGARKWSQIAAELPGKSFFWYCLSFGHRY